MRTYKVATSTDLSGNAGAEADCYGDPIRPESFYVIAEYEDETLVASGPFNSLRAARIEALSRQERA